MTTLEVQNLASGRYQIKCKISFTVDYNGYINSEPITCADTPINNLVNITVKIWHRGRSKNFYYLFLKFTKGEEDDNKYEIIVTCNGFQKTLSAEADAIWRIFEEDICHSKKEIIMEVSIKELIDAESPFKSLFEDTSLTDFQLQGDNCKIDVHKVILCTSSPVMYRMLSERWKETDMGILNIPGASEATLINLKQYIYCKILPNDNESVKSLLLLAQMYLIKDLAIKCINQLINNFKVDDICDLLSFSVENNIKQLQFRILQLTYNKTFDLASLSKLFAD